MKLASWNINSVRLRIDQVIKLLNEESPDVLCLQETKCPPGQFPSAAFHSLGYHHIFDVGQAGYHGVAIVSRIPFLETSSRQFCKKADARYCSVRLDKKNMLVHNFYVPAGGDEPDPVVNEKFAHKISFLDEMRSWLTNGGDLQSPTVLVGDLNIAPLEHDVWSHKALLGVVSHTPIETEILKDILSAGGWTDAMRRVFPEDQKLFTWWSYRARDWRASNRGRRLDHIWVRGGLESAIKDVSVRVDCRAWDRASDHVPVLVSFDW